MPVQNDNQAVPKSNHRQHWPLVGLMMVVLAVSILAFQSPIAQERGETTPQADEAPADIPDADEQTIAPEEIGYTDGIIFWSTILVLILLAGTIREMIHREGI
jgi:hypothetical protein